MQILKAHILAGFFLIFAISCAKPNYVEAETATPQTADKGPEKTNDSLRRCDFHLTALGFCADLNWEHTPSTSGEASFYLTFWKEAAGLSSSLVDPQNEVFALLWMPAMGHGSAPLHIIREAVGTYHVSNGFFVMAGQWQVRVQLKSGSVVLTEASTSVNIK